MAASSLLALIDDIASVLDDVATMTKVAARKTTGVLGDDLALNAQQVSGVNADRELPVVFAVARGSLVNKAILVPAALAISALAPWAVTPLLMIGGAFLCYEGFEKLAHRFLHSAHDEAEHAVAARVPEDIDPVAFEREKIKGAVRTDFVLSAEIIAITLGAAADAEFLTRVLVLSGIALLMTVGVYGFVAGIVKLDDAGLYLSRKSSAVARVLGRGLLAFAPRLMKLLSVAGTIAMFMVGGGILAHGFAPVHHGIEHLAEMVHSWPAGAVLAYLAPSLLQAVFGVLAGAAVLAVVSVVGKLVARIRS